MKKVRVYEYAKEIGKQSKDIIKVLRESEIEVSNHMSMLTEEGLAKLDRIFKAQKEEPKVSVTNNQPQPQTPKNDFPNVEQKEEFTIIEKRSTEEDSRIQERRNKLKEFNSSRFQGNDEKKIDIYEMIPAFRRRNIDVDFENPLDREQKISSFISENDKGKMEVRRNKFLNKDVD